MRINKTTQRGFIGLLMLLIGVALGLLFMVRSDLFSGKKEQKSTIEQGLDAVDKAKEVKALIEQRIQSR